MTTNDSHEKNEHVRQNDRRTSSRRAVLKALGGTTLGSLSVSTLSDVTQASHGGGFVSKKEWGDDATDWGYYGNLQLSSSTSLGYVTSYTVGDYVYHKLYFSTTAGSEWESRGEKADQITNHSFTIDGSDPGFLSDIYSARTGISNTSNGSDDAAENLATLAKSALGIAEAPLTFALDVLEGATAFIDLFTDDNTNQYIRGQAYDRLDALDSTPHKAKHQGHFEIEVPKGESGWVTFESSTTAKEYGTPCCTTPAEVTITNRFELWCDDQDVAIYSTRY